MNLVDFGFRYQVHLIIDLLIFKNLNQKFQSSLFVSATPGNYELEKTGGEFVEQIIRPTGLLDPIIEIRKSSNQLDDFLLNVKNVIEKR